jgi:hypothetical protein
MQKRQRHGVGGPRVGPFPKLSEIRCFYSFSRFSHTRTPCRCRFRGGRSEPMGGGDGGTNGCVVGGGALGVSGPQTPKFSSICVEKRLRNDSETARATAEYIDREELHCHRTRHRGGDEDGGILNVSRREHHCLTCMREPCVSMYERNHISKHPHSHTPLCTPRVELRPRLELLRSSPPRARVPPGPFPPTL